MEQPQQNPTNTPGHPDMKQGFDQPAYYPNQGAPGYTDGMPPQPQLHNSEQYPPQQNMQGYPQQQGMGQGQPQYVIQEERECNIELPGIHCC
ncbi:hypothetical protein NliqN6_4651 [Naganishia liquefaciens]|uniref:Uncharacterized protein n=1 Tax=Naganishia liquefaciens TaxID=104408 RepID=A0A8H3TY07_9TREE|nr:hypothetical protein NliqN6_4651 [Naganishia liquefaciens]